MDDVWLEREFCDDVGKVILTAILLDAPCENARYLSTPK